MNRRMLLSVLLVLSVLSPVSGHAQQIQTETVTAQLHLTTPAGTTIIGTVVGERSGCIDVHTNWTFTGTVNGTPAHAAGTATEHWLGNGREDIELLAVTRWDMPLPRPPLGTFHGAQTAPGLISIIGIPMAIDGNLEPPCSGKHLYMLSTPGVGTRAIDQLPNTAGMGSLLLHPFIVTAVLIASGSILLILSRRLRDSRER